jgi:hypothetical protein
MEVHDDAFRVTSEDGLVILDGPHGMALTLTPGAAIRSCKLIMDSAAIAAADPVKSRPLVWSADQLTLRPMKNGPDLASAVERLKAFRASWDDGDEIDDVSHLTADDLDAIIAQISLS